jgi:hypothetical protein
MITHNITIDHTPIIREIVKLLGCETYLELGVLKGDTIHAIVPFCKRCIGVDIDDIREFKDFEFYKKSTRDFFSTYTGMADVIFIDADHCSSSVKVDFFDATLHLNKYGVIILHDTDPMGKEYLRPDLCNDSYKVVEWIEQEFPQFNILTLPVSVAGLTIVNRKQDRRIYDYL